jgi:hypothetical protein
VTVCDSVRALRQSVFWEAPAGVGFSYCNGGSCPAWNDTNTAVDNANFLCEFFALYPEYAGRDFYLTGESCRLSHNGSGSRTDWRDSCCCLYMHCIEHYLAMYLCFWCLDADAGVYIPTVTLEIMKRKCPRPINLKGMAIGNGTPASKLQLDTSPYGCTYLSWCGTGLI